MKVDDLITEVLRKEGSKYTNDPKDSGGPTKYGITQNTLTLATHHPCTPEDVANLTEDKARTIYKNLFYYGPGISRLPEPLQAVVFDWGVNSGCGRAIHALQKVIQLAGFECDQDGIIDDATVAFVQTAYDKMGKYLINAYCEYRCDFYQRLAQRRPKDQRFLKGWLARANSFRVE